MKPLSVENAPSVPWAGAGEALMVKSSPSPSLQKIETFAGLPVRSVISSSAKHTGALFVTVTVIVAGSDSVSPSSAR